jgi:hypothetical protein
MKSAIFENLVDQSKKAEAEVNRSALNSALKQTLALLDKRKGDLHGYFADIRDRTNELECQFYQKLDTSPTLSHPLNSSSDWTFESASTAAISISQEGVPTSDAHLSDLLPATQRENKELNTERRTLMTHIWDTTSISQRQSFDQMAPSEIFEMPFHYITSPKPATPLSTLPTSRTSDVKCHSSAPESMARSLVII